jgi:hypothetical protein
MGGLNTSKFACQLNDFLSLDNSRNWMIGTWGCCVKRCFLNKRIHKKLFVKKKERVDITAFEDNNHSLSVF